MTIIGKLLLGSALAGSLFSAGAASAATTVYWADLQNASAGVVGGVIAAPSGNVGVTFNGSYSFAQTAGGIDYWSPTGYTQGVVNRPTGSDIIAFDAGGAKTITFSKTVTDPFIAFNSWNGNTVTFSSPFTVISQGCGYWGCGTFVPSNGNKTFFGSGETTGVLQFKGTFTSLSFTDTSENWHGIQIGIADVGGGVPEPATWALMISGFGLAGAALRRRRIVAA